MSALPLLPRDPNEPGLPPTPTKTLTRWTQFLGAIAAGSTLPDAKQKYYITQADIEACTRSDPLELQRWKDACIAGRKKKWNVLQLQEIFGRIAEGKTLKDAQVAVMGTYDSKFNELVVMDPELNEQYMRALEARALITMEPIFEITDDRSRDTLEGPRGGEIPNMAAVSRDKLMAETRIRVAGMWNKRLYGEQRNNTQVNVQINNHAERLEEARARANLRDKRPALLTREVIDAAFSEKSDEDTSWMDDKPQEAVWREET